MRDRLIDEIRRLQDIMLAKRTARVTVQAPAVSAQVASPLVVTTAGSSVVTPRPSVAVLLYNGILSDGQEIVALPAGSQVSVVWEAIHEQPGQSSDETDLVEIEIWACDDTGNRISLLSSARWGGVWSTRKVAGACPARLVTSGQLLVVTRVIAQNNLRWSLTCRAHIV